LKIGEAYSLASAEGIQGRASARERGAHETQEHPMDADSIGGGVVMKAAESRAARVEEIQRAVQNGTYKINTSDVSRKIINRHLDR
jgi:anti-sigma28 factor (negative regulator of flagellin synthesis)